MSANLNFTDTKAFPLLGGFDCARLNAVLHITEKITNGRFGCSSDAYQSIHGNIFHAALDLADVFGIQISKLRQFFLGKFRISTAEANCFGQQFAMFQDFMRHNLKV